METMFWIWASAAILFLVIELITPTLVFIGFVIGAISTAAYAQSSPESYGMQVGIFLVVSLILLPFTRKLASKITKPEPEKSNVDRMIGKVAIVTKAIDPAAVGQVRIEGEVWAAQADVAIAINEKVMIKEIVGTRVKVEKFSD